MGKNKNVYGGGGLRKNVFVYFFFLILGPDFSVQWVKKIRHYLEGPRMVWFLLTFTHHQCKIIIVIKSDGVIFNLPALNGPFPSLNVSQMSLDSNWPILDQLHVYKA